MNTIQTLVKTRLTTLFVLLLISQNVSFASISESSEKVVITPEFIRAIHEYGEVYSFCNGLAKILKDGKCGFINTKGELVVPCKLEFMTSDFEDGYATMIDYDGYLNIISKSGKIRRTDHKVDQTYYSPFGEGLMPSRHGDVGFGGFLNGVAEVKLTDTEEPIFVDRMGERTGHNESFDNQLHTKESAKLTIFEKNVTDKKGQEWTLYGLKDKSGKIIVPAIYWSIDDFHNGVANAILFVGEESDNWRYMPNGLYIYGYIDENGNTTFTKEDFDKIEQYKRQHGY